ncbi:MAG: aminoacyl-tRNA hydrolase [Planctomycetes bacterium]|nr:aminoacyl-tRNA hydrolase [Planctomycetota bacterium]
MKIVLGIGNPGEKYRETRHNIGWRLADALADDLRADYRKGGFEFWTAEGKLGRSRVWVVKTWTYVNETGRVIPELRARGGSFDPSDFLVVCDDIALPLGSLRIRMKGSSGGHNGLKSIEAALGHQEYARMRLGVGGPGAAAHPDYVLSRFRKSEQEAVQAMVATAVEAVKAWVAVGIEKSMTQFNRVPRIEL